MTGNITSGKNQSYDLGHGIRMFQGLRPDIALVQEFLYGENTKRDLREFVDEAFGKQFYYFRESEASDTLPNGIVSRYPILDAGEWNDPILNNRDFVWARLDIPGKRKLWVVSLHWSTRNAKNRLREARALARFVKDHVPKGDYLMVGGDLNTKGRDEEAIEVLKEFLSDRHVPRDQDGNNGTNAGRENRYDYLLPDPKLDQHHACVEFFKKSGTRSSGPEFPDGLVFDSRVFFPLNVVDPVQRMDSGAAFMQHMPVVKDYLLPD